MNLAIVVAAIVAIETAALILAASDCLAVNAIPATPKRAFAAAYPAISLCVSTTILAIAKALSTANIILARRSFSPANDAKALRPALAASNLAYKLQKEFELYILELVYKAISITGKSNVILTGGCALNCVSNYRLLKNLPKHVKLYVEPISDDSGVSMGAVKYLYYKSQSERLIPNYKDFSLDTLYLGQQINYNYELKENEIEKDTTPHDVAKLIVDGNIVAICQGRSEAGPRALGNRSILFDPRVKNGKDIVNTVKKREYFRPFAGTVLLEHASDWFDMDKLKETPYMMYAVDVLENKRDLIPAITHVDGTCRIQTLRKEQNENYYNLIEEYYRLTEVPILSNTSFNLAGDTIVETIEDAFRTLRESEIEYMYLPEIKKLIYVPNEKNIR